MTEVLTIERLREVLTYDASSGEFRWRTTLSRRVVAGSIAGYVSSQCGSRLIEVGGKTYTAQRLAWAYSNGEWPKQQVQPLNGDRANTAIANLFLPPNKKAEMTAESLRKEFHYDPMTGRFTRRQTKGASIGGSVAGCPNGTGYLVIGTGGKVYLAHRLAWLYVRGEWPAEQIDHINGIRDDNRIANLRDVTAEINSQNQRVARAASGLMGAYVSRDGEKTVYKAGIGVSGRRIALGTYATAAEAHAVYVAAKRRLHAGCTI